MNPIPLLSHIGRSLTVMNKCRAPVAPPLPVNNIFVLNCRDKATHSIEFFFMYFCPATMTTHAESINSDLQHGLDRRLRHTTLNTE